MTPVFNLSFGARCRLFVASWMACAVFVTGVVNADFRVHEPWDYATAADAAHGFHMASAFGLIVAPVAAPVAAVILLCNDGAWTLSQEPITNG